MALSWSRSLNVRRTERPRLAWLYVMLFTSILGCVWGEAVIEAGFLRDVGVKYLPLAIAGSALASMGSLSVYNLFADRIANHKLLIRILTVSLLGLAAGVLLLAEGWSLLAFPLLYVLDSALIRDLLNVHWPVYVNGFFDTQSAKRIFPVLSSASRLAAIVAGLTMPVPNRGLSSTGIIAVMLVTQAAMLSLVFAMRRALPDSTETITAVQSNPGIRGGFANIQEGYRFVAGSRYLRWIAVITFLTMVVLAFLTYQTGRLLLTELRTVQNMSNFTALLRGLGNLIALPFQLFMFSRVIGRIGVGNASLIYPAASFVAVTGLTLLPNLLTAGFGYITRSVLRNTFYIPVDGLLYNAVPLRLKARARGFISGYVMSAGSLAGGLLIMFNPQQAGPLLGALFACVALAYLGSSLQVRRHYSKAVVAMLDHDDYLSLQAPSEIEYSVVDEATLNKLAAKMAHPATSPEMKGFIAQVICQVGGAQAIPILDAEIRAAGDSRARVRLLEVIVGSGSDPVAVEEICCFCLSDPAKEVRLAALVGLEALAPGADTPQNALRVQTLVGALLADPEPHVRAAALATLVQWGCFYAQPVAGDILESLLNAEEPDVRARAVRLLGKLAPGAGQPAGAEASRLLASLRDPDDAVRLVAAHALEEAAGPAGSKLPGWLPLPVLEELRGDRVERIRQTAVTLLGRRPEPAAWVMLTGALGDPSPNVRTAAVSILAQAGSPVVLLVHPLLDSDNPQSRTAGAAVLGRIDPARFSPIVLSGCVSGHLQSAYRCWAYLAALDHMAASPAIKVLQCALREESAHRIDDVFYLLRSIRPRQTVDRAAESLHSPDARVRANAVEALEVLTTPQIARLLGTLCEEPPITRHILALRSVTWGQPAPSIEETIGELVANRTDSWLSQLATIAGGISPQDGHRQEDSMLSAIEKVIFLKEVPFFQGMTVDQLRVLANVCEEEFFCAGDQLFKEGDRGGVLYVVVSGRVGIEQEKRKGSSVRLATIEAHSYLGETDFFDNNCRTNSAIAIQDTLTLKLRREPLIALARQHPDLSLELINVLSERLREANNRIADLTRARPRELHKLYDQLG